MQATNKMKQAAGKMISKNDNMAQADDFMAGAANKMIPATSIIEQKENPESNQAKLTVS